MLWLNAKAGMLFLRNYDAMNAEYKVIDNLKTTFKPSPFINVGISLRLKDQKVKQSQ